MIHWQILARRTLPEELQEVMKGVLSSLYFVKVSTLHSRLFSQLCNDLDTLNKALFHMKVTRRNVLKCVLELCDECKMFVNRKQDLILEHCPVIKVNCLKTAHLIDIAIVKELNLSLRILNAKALICLKRSSHSK